MWGRCLGVTMACLCIVGGPAAAQVPGRDDLFRAGPDTYAPRYDPVRHDRPAADLVAPDGAVADGVIPGVFPDSHVARRSRSSNVEPRGYLRLLVQPVTAQVYVDGYFVGTIEDFASTSGPIVEAGTHRVEVGAPGYETETFDVSVVADEISTYRTALARAADARTLPTTVDRSRPTAESPVLAPRTFYVIPRCYAGDAPPQPSQLPAGCDAADLRTLPGSGTPRGRSSP